MKAALVLAALFVASLAYAGEPRPTVGNEWTKPTRRPELSRAALMYGEPKVIVGDIKPVRRPELARWLLTYFPRCGW